MKTRSFHNIENILICVQRYGSCIQVSTMNDTYFMKRALRLAAKGGGWTSPNPMVGAVVVRDGKIIGEGWHKAAGTPHAEVIALDNAGDRASGATLYVTLEPCNHFGRTPPCTARILEAGIARVVMAMNDPNPSVKGGGADFLKASGVSVMKGICEEEARKLNECFIKHTQTGLPFVVVKCAATLDGQTASRSGDSKWISCAASREFVHRLRHRLDAILVGINTVRSDNPMLTTRLEDEEGKDPIRIVLDTNLSIDPEAKVFNKDSSAKTLIATGPDPPEEKIEKIREKGAEVLICPLKKNRISLDWLMKTLGTRGIMSVLVEGGSMVIGNMIAEKLADKLCFFYAPRILGGNDGYPIIRGHGSDKIGESLKVSRITVYRFDDDIMIEGYPEY